MATKTTKQKIREIRKALDKCIKKYPSGAEKTFLIQADIELSKFEQFKGWL